jgi:ATP-dependent protease HslVU (ClpYQ) ATPase subunit
MRKLIVLIVFICLQSFHNKTSTRETAFQAVQVQSYLREDLYWVFIDNPSLENESNYIDAKYVESLLNKIVNDSICAIKQTISEAARVQTVIKEELYEIYLATGNPINEKRYVDAKYVENLIVNIRNDNDSSNN